MPKIADLLGIVGSTFTIGSRSLTAGLRRLAFRSGSFLGTIDWTITAARTITLPDDSVTLLGDDRPIGVLNAGVSLRGYEPIITVAATKTLSLADSGTVQNCTNAAAAIVTIPLNSAVAFPIGSRITIRKSTTFSVTLALAAGVSVVSELGTALVLTDIANDVILRKTGTDTWSCRHSIPLSANLPGDPTCVTQSVGSNNTRIATTAFLRTTLTSSPALTTPTLTGATLVGATAVNGTSFASSVPSSFTGATTVPTVALGDVSLQAANTTFVSNTVGANSAANIRYLFILAGESNAGGGASNSLLTTDQLQPQSQCQIWNNTTSTFQSLQIGTNNLIGHTVLPDNATHGIERGLARDIRNVINLPEAYLVKAGQGSSTIAQWAGGNASGYLATLTSRYNAANSALVARGFTVRPVVIWMQGVNDADQGTVVATWRTATQALFAQLRSFMGLTTPIFFPLIMTDTTARIAINTEIVTIDNADNLLWSVPTSNVPNNPADQYHYTSGGYLAIAERIVDTFSQQYGLKGSYFASGRRLNNSVTIVSRTTPLSTVAAATFMDLVFNNAIRNGSGAYNTLTGIFTAPYSGMYGFSATVRIDGSGYITLMICQTTGAELLRVATQFSSGVAANQANGRMLHYLNAGDTRKFNVAASGALALTVESSNTSQLNCFASIEYLGPDA